MDDIEDKNKLDNEESTKDSKSYVSRFFNPCNDIAFKKVFVNHPESTKSFLNATLKLEGSRQIETVEFLPTERLPKTSESKKSILDVLCTDQDKHQFIIEVQNKSMQHYIQRAQYYVSHLYSSQMEIAEDYKVLKPVTLLSLMNHRIFPDEIGYISFHNNIEQDTQVSYLNDMSYVFIEMPKFHKQEKDLKTVADYWIFMMKEAMYASKIPEHAPEEVKQAYHILEKHTWTREESLAYERVRMNLMDDFEALRTAEEKGKIEGREEGRLEERENFALKLLQDGMNIQKLCQLTGFTEEQIKSLKD